MTLLVVVYKVQQAFYLPAQNTRLPKEYKSDSDKGKH